MAKKQKKAPPFTRADFAIYGRILYAAAQLADGRTTQTKMYRKLSMMLAYANANLPEGWPRG